MGFFDFLRGKPSASVGGESLTPPVLPTEPVGVSGTANYDGRLQVERNAALRDALAYGRSGTTEWGEWEEIRRANPFVAMGVEFVLGPIEDADVEVKPGEVNGVVTPLAQEQADFVRWNLDALGPRFRAIRARTADCMLTAGFSLWEYRFAQRPDGRWYVPDLEERLPSSLAPNPWREDAEGRLVAVRQQAPGPMGRWALVDIPTTQLLRFTWQQTGKNYAGFSAFRAVWYIAARVMPELLRLIGVTYQREGAGVPVAFAADPKAVLTPDQREQFEELLANLVYHENASAVLPPGWEMQWIFSGGANKGHVLECWKQLGVIVLQQVGAQQLALGTGETGSRSVGEVHDARSEAYSRKIGRTLTDTYSELARRIVEANWGPQDAYPTVTLTLPPAQTSVTALVDAMTKAKQVGALTVTLDDENALRRKLGLRPIEESEREQPKQVEPAPTIEAAKPSLKASVSPWAPWRPLRASEGRTDWPRIDEYLASRREAFERAVRPVVVEMLVRAAPDITSAMADGDPSEVATLALDTKRLDETVAEFLAGVRRAGGDFARGELRRDEGEALAEARRVLTGAAEEEDDRAAQEAEDDADEIEDAQRTALVRRMSSRLRGELEAEAIDALRTGDDASEVVSRTVTRQLDTGAFKADAGTVVGRIFNVGRDEAARILGGVAEVEYSAVLDGAVCASCEALDGRTAEFGSAEHDALVPPNRDCDGGSRCRCLLVFIPERDE